MLAQIERQEQVNEILASSTMTLAPSTTILTALLAPETCSYKNRAAVSSQHQIPRKIFSGVLRWRAVEVIPELKFSADGPAQPIREILDLKLRHFDLHMLERNLIFGNEVVPNFPWMCR